VADLSTVEGREQAIAGVRALTAGGLDGLVTSAGLGPATKPASVVARVNFFGSQSLVDGLADLLALRKGAIVMISSNSAPMGTDENYVAALLKLDEEEACRIITETGSGQIAYGGSKLAITRWMRRRCGGLAAQGVRINAVAPGMTRTALTDSVLEDAELGPAIKAFSQTVPLGGVASPGQIADVVTFLLSPAASFVCGSVFFVDGGHDATLRPDQF
jgi:NAD(P)-dependent dehydrogenase (short-subunit alcohol dehydrogenase family)